jgi:hypothetical protein
MTPILAIALVLVTFCPALSIAAERSPSPMARLQVLTLGHQQKRMTPRPTILAQGWCSGECLKHGCRCDHPDTCNVECCTGNFQCDSNNYCQCVGG